MQPQTEAKPDEANVQQSLPNNESKIEVKEDSPPIKSEENKKNWATFRAQREEERKARIEAEKKAKDEADRAEALRKALEAITAKPNISPNEPLQHQEESEDDRINKKVQAAIDFARKKYEQELAEKEARELPQKLKNTFGDFEEVCSDENMDYLDYHFPEITQAYRHMPDSVEKFAGLYRAVKKFVPNTDSKKEKARVEKNLAKPGSISSTGATQGPSTLVAPKLTEERRAANWERMQRTMKGLS